MSKLEQALEMITVLHHKISSRGIGLNVIELAKLASQAADTLVEGIKELETDNDGPPRYEIKHITSNEYQVFALCADGSVWQTKESHTQWKRLPIIPIENKEEKTSE